MSCDQYGRQDNHHGEQYELAKSGGSLTLMQVPGGHHRHGELHGFGRLKANAEIEPSTRTLPTSPVVSTNTSNTSAAAEAPRRPAAQKVWRELRDDQHARPWQHRVGSADSCSSRMFSPTALYRTTRPSAQISSKPPSKWPVDIAGGSKDVRTHPAARFCPCLAALSHSPALLPYPRYSSMICRAIGAATRLPLEPFSTITATAMRGSSTGAKETNNA